MTKTQIKRKMWGTTTLPGQCTVTLDKQTESEAGQRETFSTALNRTASSWAWTENMSHSTGLCIRCVCRPSASACRSACSCTICGHELTTTLLWLIVRLSSGVSPLWELNAEITQQQQAHKDVTDQQRQKQHSNFKTTQIKVKTKALYRLWRNKFCNSSLAVQRIAKVEEKRRWNILRRRFCVKIFRERQAYNRIEDGTITTTRELLSNMSCANQPFKAIITSIDARISRKNERCLSLSFLAI